MTDCMGWPEAAVCISGIAACVVIIWKFIDEASN